MPTDEFYRSSTGEILRTILFAGLVGVQLAFAMPTWLVAMTALALLVSAAGIYSNRTRPMVAIEQDQLRFKSGLLRPEDQVDRAEVDGWRRAGGDGLFDSKRFVLELDDEADLVIPESALRSSPDDLADALERWFEAPENGK